MEKIKNKSIIIILIFVALIITMTTSSKASFDLNGKKISTNADLASYAESNPEKFVNTSYRELLKKTVTVGGGKKYGRASDINFFTSGCLYHRQSDIEGTLNKIVGVIDIDGSNATVNGEAIEFSSDETTRKRQEYAISKMGYAIWNAQQSKDTDKESVEKNAIRYLWFKDDFCWLLKKYTDIPKSFYTNSTNGALTTGTNDGDSYAKEIQEVEKNKYMQLHKTDTGTATIKEKSGEQFLGPFKVSYSGYDDVKNLTLTIDGKSYKLDSYYIKESGSYKKQTGDIVKNKSFYVKLVNNVDMNKQHKWSLKLETGNKKQYKAKIVLVSNPNASGQNLLIWGAEQIKGKDSVEWSGSTKGKPIGNQFSLQKVDDRDEEIPLEGVGFTFTKTVMQYLPTGVTHERWYWQRDIIDYRPKIITFPGRLVYRLDTYIWT